KDTKLGEIGRQMFERAQWVKSSEASQSIAQMAARTAKSGGALGAIIRERQDLVDEWQGKDKEFMASKGRAPAQRVATTENALAARMTTIDARIAEIDGQLAREFPDYATFSSSKPISVAEVQSALRDDEALVLFLDT